MRQEENLIHVHSSVSWLQCDEKHLQIRVPDGQNLTLEESSFEVAKILQQLSEPRTYEDTVQWALTNDIDPETLDTALSTLNEYSIIVESSNNSAASLPSIFKNVLDFNINSSKALRSGLPFPYFNHLEVEGDGDLKNLASDAAEDVSSFLNEYNKSSELRSLRVVCSTSGNQQYLREQNKQAVKDGVAMLAVQWNDEMLSIGPLYIPNESACYECLTVRRRAATNFLTELDASLNGQVQRPHEPKMDKVISQLAGYAIGRYLSIVTTGMFHLIKPNEVETWDVIKGEKQAGEVLKVPRCDVCGRKKSSDPIRAIRDLNS